MRKEDIFIGTQEEIENYIKENFEGYNNFMTDRLSIKTQIEDLRNTNGFGFIFFYHFSPDRTTPMHVTLTKINVWIQNYQIKNQEAMEILLQQTKSSFTNSITKLDLKD